MSAFMEGFKSVFVVLFDFFDERVSFYGAGIIFAFLSIFLFSAVIGLIIFYKFEASKRDDEDSYY